jgi:hypothetical protein
LPPLPLPPVNLNQSTAIEIVALQIDIPIPADPPPPPNVETILPDTAPPPQASGPAPHADVKPKALYVRGTRGSIRPPSASARKRDSNPRRWMASPCRSVFLTESHSP